MLATLSNPIKLSQLNQLIQSTIENNFREQWFGIIAETTGIAQYPLKNQCYLTLIEKCDQTDKILASVKARIWGNNFKCIQLFEETTGQLFKDNIQLLLKVRVHYHVQFGLSLEVEDIDCNYTIGKLALSRQAVLQKLISENSGFIKEQNGEYITHNKKLAFPPVIQKIALISSAQADGYADFLHELYYNTQNFTFTVDEYLAPVQGADAHREIYKQLVRIFESQENYDAVVLVRGGGSQIDFQAYDSYLLARAVARFPIPIITGIGHEKNESVCDLMAKLKTKTPTKAAASIITHNQNFAEKLLYFQKQLVLKTNEILISQELVLNAVKTGLLTTAKELLNSEKNKLKAYINSAIHQSTTRLQRENVRLLKVGFNLKCSVENQLKSESFNLKHLLTTLQHLDPKNILKRGYAIIYQDGKIITKGKNIELGSFITTRLQDVEFESQVRAKVEKYDD